MQQLVSEVLKVDAQVWYCSQVMLYPFMFVPPFLSSDVVLGAVDPEVQHPRR